MNIRWFVLLASLVLVAIGAVMAQDDTGKVNDPGFNERANACFAGGSLEGKCHTTDADRDNDIDQLDIDFMWWCGWYIIRVEYKQLPASVVPDGCYFEPAPPPTPTAAPTETPIDDDCPPLDDDDNDTNGLADGSPALL